MAMKHAAKLRRATEPPVGRRSGWDEHGREQRHTGMGFGVCGEQREVHVAGGGMG